MECLQHGHFFLKYTISTIEPPVGIEPTTF